MKDCFCPSCGRKQIVMFSPQSKVVMPCCACGKSLMIKLDYDALTVKVQNVLVPKTGG